MTQKEEIKALKQLIEQQQQILNQLVCNKDNDNESKKSDKTSSKKKSTKKEQSKVPYSAVPDIINKMSKTENIKRFGILYNADKPYAIKSKAIEQFYNDYNIDKRFKVWHMAYSNKDLIINGQLKGQSKAVKKQSIENRIKQIEEQLNKQHKGKTTNQSEKINDFLTAQIQKLEEMLE